MRQWLKIIQQFLLPTACVLCQGAITAGEPDLCLACFQELPWLEGGCRRCALPLLTTDNCYCGRCLQEPPLFDKLFALFHYQSPIDLLLTQLKFHGQLIYARVLAEVCLQRLELWYAQDSLPQCLIPMPLHRQRLRQRGFNQVVELTRPLAKKFKLPLILHECKRVKPTLAQSELSASARQQNVKNAFSINSSFRPQHVAIVDDIVTTASTVTALSAVLRAAGVERIDVWCWARTIR